MQGCPPKRLACHIHISVSLPLTIRSYGRRVKYEMETERASLIIRLSDAAVITALIDLVNTVHDSRVPGKWKRHPPRGSPT